MSRSQAATVLLPTPAHRVLPGVVAGAVPGLLLPLPARPLFRLGFAVRDEGDRQYWRPLVRS